MPAELIFDGKDFRREIMGIDPPQDIYTHISGIDLIRDEPGRYLVLEDNLRTPSGVSYMIENRVVERRILPEFFAHYRVRRVEHYPALLLEALRYLSPRGKDARRDRAAHPGHLQLGVLRAHLPRQGDGHRAGRGPRPGGEERRRLHEDDARPAARRRGLPPRRRRLPRSALLPRRLRRSASPASSTPGAPATSPSSTRPATASPTTRRSTRSCPTSSATTSASRRSSRTCRPI